MNDKKNLFNFTEEEDLNLLLNNIANDIANYGYEQVKKIQSLVDVGRALSAEKNINAVFGMIIEKAQEFTHADGGSIYIVTPNEKELQFKVVRTTSLNIEMGGASINPITWPNIPIINADGTPNMSNVCSYAAYTGKAVNIRDVYYAAGFDFSGTKKFDEANNYRSKSMLVLPMRNHEEDIIGVLQLINATKDGKVISFSRRVEVIAEALASQAAVALTNSILIHDLEQLLESFIRSIARGMGVKSPHTGNHIRRVAELTMKIANVINEENEGKYKHIYFNDDKLKALRIAAWMHDIGKITTPEYILGKATKLQTIFDRIILLRTRFDLIKETKRSKFLQLKIEMMEKNEMGKIPLLKAEYNKELKKLEEEVNLIEECNVGEITLPEERIEKIENIGLQRYQVGNKEYPYLSKDEITNLNIIHGTLTDDEKNIIKNHAKVSYDMLHELPFPKKMKNVPIYASGHHERLDGTGYPLGLKAEQLSLQTRILALADIFEALTAYDRPYKKGMPLSRAMKIMEDMVEKNYIDGDLFKLFKKHKLHLQYAKKELKKEQVDIK